VLSQLKNIGSVHIDVQTFAKKALRERIVLFHKQFGVRRCSDGLAHLANSSDNRAYCFVQLADSLTELAWAAGLNTKAPKQCNHEAVTHLRTNWLDVKYHCELVQCCYH